jgi:6,7-dimethyl-8-ribityllumazine synthase
LNILIVESRYHPEVTDTLVDGATAALEKGGARFERMAVPGVLEIPAAIAMAVRSARPYDGYVALGSAAGPQGHVFHTEVMRALLVLGTTGIAVGNGIVMAADEGSAHDLATRQDIGGEAGRAAIALVIFGERLGFGQ